jgi:hypothetical protein
MGIPTARPIGIIFQDFEVFVEDMCWPAFDTVDELKF